MSTRRRREPRRTDLFLVRLWMESATRGLAAGGSGTVGSGSGAPHARAWHGSVQRVVDGEAHEFQDWPGLVETLLAMLPATGATLDG